MATFHRDDRTSRARTSSAASSRARPTSCSRARPRTLDPTTCTRSTDRRRFRQRYLAENERLGEQGLRVLATARKDFEPGDFDPNADLLDADGRT